MVPMKEAINKMGLNLPCPSSQEWSKVQSLVDFLEPFDDATKMLSGSSYCTLSQANFLMTALKDHMTKNLHTTSDFGVQDMLTKAAKYAQDLETQSLLPTFLDPRYFKAMTSANRKVATTLKILLGKQATKTTSTRRRPSLRRHTPKSS